MAYHVDIGGEGRYPGAVNVNPSPVTSTTGEPGGLIPSRVPGTGDSLPFARGSVGLVSVENAPVGERAAREIARVLAPGGAVTLLHPSDYALGQGVHDAVAGALGGDLASRVTTELADSTALTVLRKAMPR